MSSSTSERKPAHVGHQQLGRAAGLVGHPAQVVFQQRSLGDQGRQGRPKLVRDVGGEPPLARLGLRQRGDLRLQGLGHLVERRRPRAELVLGLDRKPRLQEPLGHRACGVAGLADRLQGPAGQHPPHQTGHQDDQQPAQPEHQGELAKVASGGGLGEQEVQLAVRIRRPSSDHQVGDAVHRHPLVREVAVFHQCAEALWDRRAHRRIGGEAFVCHHQNRMDVSLLVAGDERRRVRLAGGEVAPGREAQVEPGLLVGAGHAVPEPSLPNQEPRAEGQGPGGDRGHQHERHGEPSAEPSRGHPPPGHVRLTLARGDSRCRARW
jgi:hypothetical protein